MNKPININWYKISQENTTSLEPWEMTQDEFVAYHKLRSIPPIKRDNAFKWYHKTNYDTLLETKKFKDVNIEFRKSIHENTKIVGFDGDKAVAIAAEVVELDPIHTQDGIWVHPDYMGKGIGTYLLSIFRQQFNDPSRRMGMMTEMGERLVRSYHKKLIEKAIQDELLTPNHPKYDLIVKNYPQLVHKNAVNWYQWYKISQGNTAITLDDLQDEEDANADNESERYFSIGHGDLNEELGMYPDFQLWVLRQDYVEKSKVFKTNQDTGDPIDSATHGSLWGHDFCDRTYKGRYEPQTGTLTIVKPFRINFVNEEEVMSIIKNAFPKHKRIEYF